MEHVSATRSELLARRSRIALAIQGRDLLTEKRTALMREFNRLGASVLEAMQELERGAAEAERALARAAVADDPAALRSAAFAAQGEVPVTLTTRNVAGVPIVEIEHEAVERAVDDRGYSLAATSVRVDVAAERFENVVVGVLDLAALELSLRRLADEITRTTRRVNALEHVVVPRLERERDFIGLVLDEREAEGRVRLLRARRRSTSERRAA